MYELLLEDAGESCGIKKDHHREAARLRGGGLAEDRIQTYNK